MTSIHGMELDKKSFEPFVQIKKFFYDTLAMKHMNISQGDVVYELKHQFRYLAQSSLREQGKWRNVP